RGTDSRAGVSLTGVVRFAAAVGPLLGSWSGGRRAEDSTVPRQKNFKRLVRGRMAKTGESYTAARSRFVPPSSPDPSPDPEAAALSRVLGVSPGLLYGIGGGIGFAHLVFVYDGWTTVHVDGRYNALYL